MNNKKYIWSFSSLNYGYKIDIKDLIFLCYSVELVKKFSNNVHIYTDKRGLDEIQKIGIKANTTIVDFKRYNNISLNKIYSKIKTIEIQDSNFCMLDKYVFLFRDPETSLTAYSDTNTSDSTFVQSLENKNKWGMLYKNFCDKLKENNIQMCEELDTYIKNGQYSGYNCSYLDNIDKELKDRLCYESINLLNQLDRLNISVKCLICESLLLALSNNSNYKISPIFSEVDLQKQYNPTDSLKIDGYTNIYSSKDKISLNFMHPDIRTMLIFLSESNSDFYNNLIKINSNLEVR
jgi:hypothetical protein